MNRLALIWLTVFGLVLASEERNIAATINLATGLDASNTLLTASGQPEAHWTVAQTGATPQAVYPTSPDYYGNWLPNGPNSAWIARDASTTQNGFADGPNGNQLIAFNRNFDLTGYNLSTVSLSVSWAIDDQGTLSLNGHQISSLPGGAWGALTPVPPLSIPVADFNQGLNSLTIQMTGTDNFLEGVRLEGSVSGSAVPEPSSLVGLAGLAGIGLIGSVWRLRQNRSAHFKS
jgi:hypothetical protein